MDILSLIIGVFGLLAIVTGFRIGFRQEIKFSVGGSYIQKPRIITRRGLSVTIFALAIILTGLELISIAVFLFITQRIIYLFIGWVVIFLTQLIGFLISTIVHHLQKRLS